MLESMGQSELKRGFEIIRYVLWFRDIVFVVIVEQGGVRRKTCIL